MMQFDNGATRKKFPKQFFLYLLNLVSRLFRRFFVIFTMLALYTTVPSATSASDEDGIGAYEDCITDESTDRLTQKIIESTRQRIYLLYNNNIQVKSVIFLYDPNRIDALNEASYYRVKLGVKIDFDAIVIEGKENKPAEYFSPPFNVQVSSSLIETDYVLFENIDRIDAENFLGIREEKDIFHIPFGPLRLNLTDMKKAVCHEYVKSANLVGMTLTGRMGDTYYVRLEKRVEGSDETETVTESLEDNIIFLRSDLGYDGLSILWGLSDIRNLFDFSYYSGSRGFFFRSEFILSGARNLFKNSGFLFIVIYELPQNVVVK